MEKTTGIVCIVSKRNWSDPKGSKVCLNICLKKQAYFLLQHVRYTSRWTTLACPLQNDRAGQTEASEKTAVCLCVGELMIISRVDEDCGALPVQCRNVPLPFVDASNLVKASPLRPSHDNVIDTEGIIEQFVYLPKP